MFSKVMSGSEQGCVLSARILLLLTVIVALVAGCASEKPGGPTTLAGGQTGCVACHTNQQSLIATASEDTTSSTETPGEG